MGLVVREHGDGDRDRAREREGLWMGTSIGMLVSELFFGAEEAWGGC